MSVIHVVHATAESAHGPSGVDGGAAAATLK
jgi:hypothetical protein